MFTTTRNRLMLLILGLSVLIMVNPGQASAQEGSFDVNNPSYGVPEEFDVEEVQNPEEALINPEKEEPKKVKNSTKKNTPELKKETAKTSTGAQSGYSNGTKEAESVLSFNFLYYIIQRFKFTEVVDQ